MKVNDRKEELTKIAYKLFLKNGYENTSIDEIIKEAKIAKGTYYYYFESKEETLEEVVNMMLDNMVQKAKQVLEIKMTPIQKIINIIMCFKPEIEEEIISNALHLPENIVMHKKLNKKVIEEATPLLSQVVKEANKEKILNCKENISEKVKTTLMLSQNLFDDMNYTEKDIIVYIEILESLYGAEKGSLNFIRNLIGNEWLKNEKYNKYKKFNKRVF